VKKRVWFILAAVLVIVGGAVALAARKPISADNPFQNRYIPVPELVASMRAMFQPRLIEISAKNPLDHRYFQYLWLLGYPANALAQLWEQIREKPPTTLSELIEIPYMGGASRLLRLLLLFKFPDESTVLPSIRIEKPDWWDVVSKG
jgi:hypothetical protein